MSNLVIFIALIPYIIILALAFFHALLGYINGTSKTLYYIGVDIVLSLLIVFALSFVTIQNYYTTDNLLFLLEKIFTVPEVIRRYFDKPELNEVIYVLTDIIVRLLLFFGITTITKWVFKFGVFKPIYSKVISPNRKTKKDRKQAALLGSFKGAVLGVIFIIPFWIIDGPPNLEDKFPPKLINHSIVKQPLKHNNNINFKITLD